MDREVWQGNIHTYLMFTLHTVFIGALKKILQANIKLIMLAFSGRGGGNGHKMEES